MSRGGKTDVIVVGGGVCGLATAALLAKAGRKVTLFERRDTVGGTSALRAFGPGISVPGLLHDTTRIDAGVVDALSLRQHGLETRAAAPILLSDGAERSVMLSSDTEETRAWRAWLQKVAPVVRKLVDDAPIPLDDPLRKLAWPSIKLGRALRKLGRRDMMEFLRVPPMCLADWLQEWFDDEMLAAALAFPALEGTWAGPWSAGTAANLLLRETTRGDAVRGGPAAFARALESAARAAGVTIHTGTAISDIRVGGARALGITTADGQAVDASTIVSALDPKTTFLDLVPPTALDPRDADDFVNWRCRGAIAKVHLAVSGEAPFTEAGAPMSRVRVASSLDDVERSYDALKYRTVADRPTLDVSVPSIDDRTLAPDGHHIISVIYGFAPDAEAAVDDVDALRSTVAERTLDTLGPLSPGLRDRIVANEVLLPADLASEYGLAGGHLFHGELALDQIMMRPSLACRGHRSPIEGLFLCGPGTHPGTAPTAASARLAATVITRG